MLRIRLQRVGRKNDPSFRLVLIESYRAPKSGKVKEMLGFYNARHKKIQLSRDRIELWVSKGAQLSRTAKALLIRST